MTNRNVKRYVLAYKIHIELIKIQQSKSFKFFERYRTSREAFIKG